MKLDSSFFFIVFFKYLFYNEIRMVIVWKIEEVIQFIVLDVEVK